ncbi:hypothetical protein BD769DRAFT_888461 [Suillus cothurnatus]|nr:hypothetical protein BD769DRAFT_128229 [Suillus cothurnatus]KAG2124109.1 hypothetical protein BD769DRAFT_888461 [Suillus cothurnatus]
MPFGWSVGQVYPSVLIRTLSALCWSADITLIPLAVVNLLSRSSKSCIGGREYIKSHLLLDHRHGFRHRFHVVDQRTIVAIGPNLPTMHILQEFTGPLQLRLTEQVVYFDPGKLI